MSEQINKVLADRPQSFSSGEQAQARENIGAMAASASSEFAPASAGFSGVSTNNCITGDGTTSNPVGLSSKVKFENSLSSTVIGPNQLDVHNHVGTSYIGNSFINLNVNYNGGATGYMNASSVQFTDSANNTEVVDSSSIQRWNSYSSVSAGKYSASADLVLDHTSEGYSSWLVTGVHNYAINHVLVSGHNSDICDLLVKAPTLTGNQEYDYSVVFDCVDSNGGCGVDVENSAPVLHPTYNITAYGKYIETRLYTSASDAITPEAQVVSGVTPQYETISGTSFVTSMTDYYNKPYMRIVGADYYGVTEATKLAGPYVVTGVGLIETTRTNQSIGFGGSPVYQIDVLGSSWDMRSF